MKRKSVIVASAAVAAVTATLGLLPAAGPARAADRGAGDARPPSAGGTDPGSTVGRPGPTSAQGNYQADYHADYRARGTEAAAAEPPGEGARERRRDRRGVPGIERYTRTPGAWPR